jgi:hypothetical protein
MRAKEQAREVYHHESLIHRGHQYTVKFVYRRWASRAESEDSIPKAEPIEEIWAAVFDSQEPLFAVAQPGCHPLERRTQRSLPHRQERHLLTAITQRMEQERWQRGNIYHLASDWSPELVSSEDLHANLTYKLGITLAELMPIAADGAPRSGLTRDDVAMKFGLPVTEPLGHQLEQRGILTDTWA